MKRVHVYFDPSDAPYTRLDVAIELLLAGLLVFCPLTFGAVQAWSEQIFFMGSALMLLLLLVKLVWRRDARFVWTWTYLPIGIFLGLMLLQMLPLPASFVGAISPGTSRTKTELLADLPNAESALRRMTITFYTEGTIRQLRLLLAVVAAFVVVVNVYQRLDAIRRLLIAITIVGAAIAVLAIAQDIAHTDRIYWTYEFFGGLASSGPFVNHSHFCQFMNLSMGAAMALLLLQWHTFFRHGELSSLEWRQRLVSPEFRSLWLLGAVLVIGAISILFSLSRGGAMSMIAAAVVTVPLIARKAHIKGVGWIFMLLVLVVLAILFYAGSDVVYNRLASITERKAEGSRLQMLKDQTVAWKQFPLMGTGLGSYRYVFPMFDRSRIPAIATHAENEYAQTMTEAGALGLTIALVFIGMIVACYLRAIRGRRSASGSIAIGLGFGLLAILVHSASDFGQHIPANALLAAVSCGLIVTVARVRERELGLEKPPGEFVAGRFLRVASAVAVAAIAIPVAIGADQTRRSEAEFDRALGFARRITDLDWRGSEGDYFDLIAHSKAASDARPANVMYRYWLNVYRQNYLKLHGLMHDPTFAQQLVDELNQCRILCPTFGPVWCELGQIELFELGQPQGAEHIKRGFALAPSDAIGAFVAARLAASQGDWPTAVAQFRHCLAVSAGMRGDVLDVVVTVMNHPAEALQIAQGDRAMLSELAAMLASRPQDQAIANEAREQAKQLVRSDADKADCDASTLVQAGRSYADDNDLEPAIKCFRRALSLQYGAPDWHLELAKLLAAANRPDEAAREARTATIQRPHFEEAEALVRKLDKGHEPARKQ